MLDLKRYSGDWKKRKEGYTSNNEFDNVITTDDLDGIHEGIIQQIIEDVLKDEIVLTPNNKFSKHHYTATSG